MREPVDLHIVVAPVRARWKSRIGDIRRWSLSTGRPFDADITALVLATCEDRVDVDGPIDLWTRIGVYEFLWAHAHNWCLFRDSIVPLELPETLWTYLHYLREHALLDRASDPFRELLRPLRCYCGLDADGRPDRTSSGRRVKCVCKVPYVPPRDRQSLRRTAL